MILNFIHTFSEKSNMIETVCCLGVFHARKKDPHTLATYLKQGLSA